MGCKSGIGIDRENGRRRRDASENLSRSRGRTAKCTPAPAVTAGFYFKNDPDPAGIPQDFTAPVQHSSMNTHTCRATSSSSSSRWWRWWRSCFSSCWLCLTFPRCLQILQIMQNWKKTTQHSLKASENVVPSPSRLWYLNQCYSTLTQCRQHSSYYCSSTFNWKLTLAASRRFSSRVCNSASSSSVPFITTMSSSTYAFPHCKKHFQPFYPVFDESYFQKTV